MNKLKLFAVIAAMAVCGVASAMGITFTQKLNGVSVGVSQARWMH